MKDVNIENNNSLKPLSVEKCQRQRWHTRKYEILPRICIDTYRDSLETEIHRMAWTYFLHSISSVQRAQDIHGWI
jgi:hypothetical protein